MLIKTGQTNTLKTIKLFNARGNTQMLNKNKPVTVLSSINKGIITVAQSLLSEAGINYIVTGNGIKDNDSSLNSTEESSGLTKIQVAGDDNVMAARRILMDLEELDFEAGVSG